MKVSPEIIQPFPKNGQRKTGEENMETAGSLQTHQRRLKLETKEPKGVRENILGKCSKKSVKKNLVTVGSSEEEP